MFLAHKLPKLLILAATDRLDDELTIAQMQVRYRAVALVLPSDDAEPIFAPAQGRFQLVLIPGAGHLLHEDAPEVTASALAAFVRRCAPLSPARTATLPLSADT